MCPMKKLNYTDETTFLTEEVEFSDEHYQLAKNLNDMYFNGLWSKCTPMMVRADKQSLVFCVNFGDKLKDRAACERGDNMYRVIIEKINHKK
jgi:hypothetical protein